VESCGHGPVPQTVRHYAIATSPTITLWIPNWALSHVGLVGLELTPQPRQLRSLGRQGPATHASEPRQSLTSERLAPLPEHWNLSLTTYPDSTQQDKIRQLVIIILDAEDLGFSADSLGSRTETERVLHVSFHTTFSTKVSELVAAASHECQRRGTHAAFELNGARYTLGSSPADSIWRQNVNPADLRSYPISETQGQTRSEQLLHATDCLGWLKEEPRPPIFAFLPLANKFKDRRCLGRRSEPGLPHDVRNGATASAADSSGTARAEIFD